MYRFACALGSAFIGLSVVAGTPAAQEGPSFKDKTLTILIASRTGGSYDQYSRLLATHIRKHLPGNPTIIFQWHEASGGLVGSNFVQGAAPKDGSLIGTTQQTIPVSQVINPGVGRFDVRTWNLLGTMTPTRNLFAIWREGAPGTTLEAARETEIPIGATSRTSPTFIYPSLMNRFLGTKFKMVLGYQFGALHLAMEQGEHFGVVSTLYSFQTSYPQFMQDNKLVWLMQFGHSKDPALPDVPILQDLLTDPLQKQVADVVSMSNEFGFFFFLPPGVPKAMVDTWRTAFMKAVEDPELLAEAKERKMPIEPKDHVHLEKLLAQLHAAPPEVISAAREAMGVKK
jgi:tripartite-type tricarboxylate transporter receptor subunit TctC